jgi:superfamily II DNA or RNA helicase
LENNLLLIGMKMAFEARKYQVEAVENLREEMRHGAKRVMLSSPTGSGKTETAMILVRSAIDKGRRVGFLCNRINLVDQTSRRFAKAGINHGVIQGQNTQRTYENVIVASIQTVARRGMPEVDLLIIDEAHGVAGSKDYLKVITDHGSKPVIGLSATPYSKGLGKVYEALGGALFESMVTAASIQDLIEQGYLVDVDVYAPSAPDLSKVKITAGDYNERELGEAVDKPKLIGDIVTNWRKFAQGTSTVCFATNIAHSKHIVDQFKGSGVMAEHIDCYTDEGERAAILRRVAEGKTLVISNVGILCEGWDFPACRTLILARPTKSLIRYLQMAGRVLRPSEGKERALVLDHSGTVQSLGFPTDDFARDLCDGKPKKSEGGKKDEKEKPLPKPCPQCHYMRKTGGKCPICGFTPTAPNQIDHAPGELGKVEPKKKTQTTEEKRQLYAELKSVAAQRGWSDGRLANVFRDLTSVWPNAYKSEKAMPASVKTLALVKHLQIKFSKSQEKTLRNRGWTDSRSVGGL